MGWNHSRGRVVTPRMRAVTSAGLVLVMAIAGVWVWQKFRIPDFPLPPVQAQSSDQGAADGFLISNRHTPEERPPVAALPLQEVWDYSDLVCTGFADEAMRTGRIEALGGADRDQLVTRVTLENCFKGIRPDFQIRVFGDSTFAQKDIQNGYVLTGPSRGFIARGRNLLFLRKTDQPDVWRVTVPVYATCIQLADPRPAYVLDGSDAAIRRALAAEMLAMIVRGEIRPEVGGFNSPTKDPALIAWWYLRYIYQILGRNAAMREFAKLQDISPPAVRREIAFQMLWEHDQRGMNDVLALLEDLSAPDWQRANAARALEYATSPRARVALAWAARDSGSQEVARAAQESLSRMGH
jgi:hypothetical protein